MVSPMSEEVLDAKAVRIHGAQFVGTNVEMTFVADPTHDPDAAEDVAAALDALLAAKLGLYALTPTGELDGKPRFSVIASPLDRLFHKIGPIEPLTLVKHASLTMELSDTQASRTGEGLADKLAPEVVLPTWDTGKLIAVLMRRPRLLDAGPVCVAGCPLEPERFPEAILATLPEHVAEAGGVRLELPQALIDRLSGSG